MKRRRRKQEMTPERLAELRAMRYQDYLHTPEWYRRRAVLLKFAEHRCQVCNSELQLNVHHRRYRDAAGQSILGAEKISDLLCLCSGCHELFHTHRKLVS